MFFLFGLISIDIIWDIIPFRRLRLVDWVFDVNKSNIIIRTNTRTVTANSPSSSSISLISSLSRSADLRFFRFLSPRAILIIIHNRTRVIIAAITWVLYLWSRVMVSRYYCNTYMDETTHQTEDCKIGLNFCWTSVTVEVSFLTNDTKCHKVTHTTSSPSYLRGHYQHTQPHL